jgi:hypothetical protein
LPSQSDVPAVHATHAPPEHVWLPAVHAECEQPQFASEFVCSQPLA